MLILHTPWGTYILNNAIKIDFFRVENKSGTISTYISVDSHKHLIQTFESKLEAIQFTSEISILVEDFLYSYDTDVVKNCELMELCEKALSNMEKGD